MQPWIGNSARDTAFDGPNGFVDQTFDLNKLEATLNSKGVYVTAEGRPVQQAPERKLEIELRQEARNAKKAKDVWS